MQKLAQILGEKGTKNSLFLIKNSKKTEVLEGDFCNTGQLWPNLS
jgi:hypothetical protein